MGTKISTLLLLVTIASTANAIPLSNSAVNDSEVAPLFANNGPGLVAIIDGNATVPLGALMTDVHLNTRVWAGQTGTAAEGLYLYDYWLEGETNARNFSVNFSSLVAFDFGSGAGTSWYCFDCTNNSTFPDSSELVSSILSFNFLNGFDPFTTNLYAISNLGPTVVTARLTVFETGSLTYELTALAPQAVPEPVTLALLGVGLLGMSCCRKSQT